jgi:hypothetical protein
LLLFAVLDMGLVSVLVVCFVVLFFVCVCCEWFAVHYFFSGFVFWVAGCFLVCLLGLYWLCWLPQLDARLKGARFFFKSSIEALFLVLCACGLWSWSVVYTVCLYKT